MILVTGATGLLGSHLLYDLLIHGEKVRAMKRAGSSTAPVLHTFTYYSKNAQQLFDRIEWVDGDMCDYYSVEDAVRGVDYVYHCAATISFNPKDAHLMLQQNELGCANVVNACLEHKIRKACFVSSVAALGHTGTEEPITENTFWKISDENSSYAISKYASEREVWRGIEEGLNAVIVNPSIIVGPGNRNSGSSNMFNGAYEGMKFYAHGVTAFVDVRDVAKCMRLLMESESKGERFIVSSENISYKSFFDEMHRAFGKPLPSVFAPIWLSNLVWRFEAFKSAITGSNPLITKDTARSAHQKNYYSNEKIRSYLNVSFIPVLQSVQDSCGLYLRDLEVGH